MPTPAFRPYQNLTDHRLFPAAMSACLGALPGPSTNIDDFGLLAMLGCSADGSSKASGASIPDLGEIMAMVAPATAK